MKMKKIIYQRMMIWNSVVVDTQIGMVRLVHDVFQIPTGSWIAREDF